MAAMLRSPGPGRNRGKSPPALDTARVQEQDPLGCRPGTRSVGMTDPALPSPRFIARDPGVWANRDRGGSGRWPRLSSEKASVGRDDTREADDKAGIHGYWAASPGTPGSVMGRLVTGCDGPRRGCLLPAAPTRTNGPPLRAGRPCWQVPRPAGPADDPYTLSFAGSTVMPPILDTGCGSIICRGDG